MSGIVRGSLCGLLLLAGILLTACGDDLPTFAVGDQGVVVCSDDCAAHGQCGSTSDERRVILANQAGPIIRFHDRYFPEDTIVTIRDSQPRELIAAEGGIRLEDATPFPHTFYLIAGTVGEIEKTGWVSQWCLDR